MKFITRKKPRVFLGALSVVPRTNLKRHFDQWGIGREVYLDDPLRLALQEIFSLPLACEVTKPKSTDLGLEVFVTSFQLGEFCFVNLGEIGFPLIWRPKVTVVGRLYFLKSLKTKRTFSVTQKMAWRLFVNRIFSWRGISRLNPFFDAEDINGLLYLACYSLLKKVRNSLS